MGFRKFQYFFHYPLNLRIMAAAQQVGIVPYFNVGMYTLPFPEPVTVVIIKTCPRNGDASSVDQLVPGSGSYQDTKGPFTYDRASFPRPVNE